MTYSSSERRSASAAVAAAAIATGCGSTAFITSCRLTPRRSLYVLMRVAVCVRFAAPQEPHQVNEVRSRAVDRATVLALAEIRAAEKLRVVGHAFLHDGERRLYIGFGHRQDRARSLEVVGHGHRG